VVYDLQVGWVRGKGREGSYSLLSSFVTGTGIHFNMKSYAMSIGRADLKTAAADLAEAAACGVPVDHLSITPDMVPEGTALGKVCKGCVGTVPLFSLENTLHPR
jgi:hypothetical protein